MVQVAAGGPTMGSTQDTETQGVCGVGGGGGGRKGKRRIITEITIIIIDFVVLLYYVEESVHNNFSWGPS